MSDSEPLDILCNRVDKMACGHCGKHLDVADLDPFSIIECPDCQTKQTVPALLGQFLLVEQLGSGGMGSVYRAVDQALGRFVAIKVMKKALGDDPELLESFLREARAAAALNHPNIVQIYSCGQEKGQPYIVMELVAGGRLDQMMADGQKVDEVRLLEISLDVAEGLKAANAVGLVHGDIKPANILFDKSGTAKVVDFGLAQFVNRQQEQGGVWGTPYYISPERARGGKADHRSDIYSLGATMFHALTAQAPFDGKTAADVVVARLKGPPPKLRDVEPMLQPETSNLLERMMAADPVLRYPTSASLMADMRSALHAARNARSPGGRRGPPRRERGHLIILGVTVVILLVLGIVVVRWFRTESRAREASLAAAKAAAARPVPRPTAPSGSNAVPEAEGMTVEKDASGKLKMTVEFFTGDAEKTVVDATAALAGDQPLAMYDRLEAFATNVPANSARMMWVRVYEAISLRVAGDQARADKLLRDISSATIKQRPGHPVFMPQVIGQYLAGELTEESFARARADWPAWYGDLGTFCRGLRALFVGDLDEGATSFEAYLKSGRTSPGWVYAFRPAAQSWLNLVSAWEGEKAKVVALVNGGDVAGARAEIDRYAAQAPVFMKTSLVAVRDRVRQAEERLASQSQQALEIERRKVVQKDLDLLDEVMGTNVTIIVGAKDYRRVQPVLLAVQGSLATLEGREQVKILREQLDRMDALKTLLITDLERNPFRQEDRELGGEAIGANVLGVRVSLAGRGTVLRTWDQISPRLLVRLLSHTIDSTSRDTTAKADSYISLAVFCAYGGGFEAAAGFAKQAIDLNPAAAPAARRLVPDVLGES